MKHLTAMLVLLFGAACAVQAQDDPKDKLAKKPEPAKKAEQEPQKKEIDPNDQAKLQEELEKAKELMGRLSRNFQASEERLGKKDPGDITRQIQRDIVKDLDELIEKAKNRQNQNQNSSSSPSAGSDQLQPSSGQKQTGRNAEKAGQQGECKAPGGDNGGQSKGSGMGEGQNAGQAKGENQRERPAELGDQMEGQAKANGQKDKKDSGGGEVARAKDANPKVRNDLTDLFREVWGHLPEMRRQEMDAYQRERFMQRYDELLRQYYRTLSEQNRKSGD